ncbi:potassium-transporting ATPase subunit C [Duganella sp. FT3S]|uniref:Potassium-transporting ATPase subunit C n=1 Tax=Rugamonas fusca TaxID=2758568 RepID=A0A7W2EIF2_9BURK|nr:potassium-transporting ATPase subunit C [Rugamonas fusca]MBA5606434.1 potassium-transporting ATPase subunit C [Rugamonas fusca]
MDEQIYRTKHQDAERRNLPVHDRLRYAHSANLRAYLLLGVVALTCGLAFPVADKGHVAADTGRATSAPLARQAANPTPSTTGPVPQLYFHDTRREAAGQRDKSPLNGTDAGMLEAVQRRINAVQNAAPGSIMPIPIELVTDARTAAPEISLAEAQRQAESVAAGRRLSVEAVRQLVSASAQARRDDQRQVNLLALNLTLDLAATGVQ